VTGSAAPTGWAMGSATRRPGWCGTINTDVLYHENMHQWWGASVTEPELEAIFAQWLPVPTSACQARLHQFFHQWWDTAYPAGGGKNRPQITGPGLAGPGFYNSHGGCAPIRA
jgi:hypothetical protein